MGHLPLALRRRILVPLLRALSAPALPAPRTTSPALRRDIAGPRVLPRARRAEMHLRRRALHQPLRLRPVLRVRSAVLRALA